MCAEHLRALPQGVGHCVVLVWCIFKTSQVKSCGASPSFPLSRAVCSTTQVLERYPNSGKLMLCYGRFIEEVCDDVHRAQVGAWVQCFSLFRGAG